MTLLNEDIPEKIKANIHKANLSYFAEEHITLPEGKFSFNNKQYLIDLYQDEAEEIIIEKAAQMGITTYAILKVLQGCLYRYDKGAIYYFPTKTDVQDFSRSRVKPLLENCPIFRGSMNETDNVGIKQIGKAFLYLRGMRTNIGLKSVPADYIVFDEIDEAEPEKEKLAQERLSGSNIKGVIKLSNPTLPDYGVDASFKKSNQMFWNIQCTHCNTWNVLEDEFPSCLIRMEDESVIIACKRCKQELDVNNGEWVAKKPELKLRGYHFTQLYSDMVNPKIILDEYEDLKYPQIFYNMKLGFPYIEAEGRLEKQIILAICSQEVLKFSYEKNCTMGVDQGKDLHYVISTQDNMKRKIVSLGIKKEWEELDELMLAFKVKKCVVDGLPEQRNARAFALRHKGKVFLNYYSEHKKGSTAWNEEEHIVQEDRTESLDSSQRYLRKEKIILPRQSNMIEMFAEHCSNIAKKLEQDDKGNKYYTYVQLGDDHFAHAFNYDVLCWDNRSNETPIIFNKEKQNTTYAEGIKKYDRSVF